MKSCKTIKRRPPFSILMKLPGITGVSLAAVGPFGALVWKMYTTVHCFSRLWFFLHRFFTL